MTLQTILILVFIGLSAGLVSVLLLFFLASKGKPSLRIFTGGAKLQLLTTTAEEYIFEHFVVERGELQSSSNVEVRCLVKGRSSSSSINIIEIVPEGTWVEEGDFLVRLDDAALQKQLVQKFGPALKPLIWTQNSNSFFQKQLV